MNFVAMNVAISAHQPIGSHPDEYNCDLNEKYVTWIWIVTTFIYIMT